MTTQAIEKLSVPVGPNVALSQVCGADFGRHNNLHVIDTDTILYAVGNAVRIHNITTGAMRYIFGRDGAGVGAVAVHPARTHFAVAERSHSGPNIYIYKYPSLELAHVLVGGTERGFSDLSFSTTRNGAALVSVGSFPDFLLAVWDWESGRLVLRTKAFGQDVFNARFSPDDEGRLTTSGTGHIRFWKMASTFTGLKLQGDIGKFGRVDLSDIHAFAELPDGKVVSGCEGGYLLLWDGGAIKTQIGRIDAHGTPCADVPGASTGPAHDAAIHVVSLDRALGMFLTGGDDGTLRWWDWKAVDSSDMLPDGVGIPGCSLVSEHFLGARVRVRGITKLSDITNTEEEVGGGTAAATDDDTTAAVLPAGSTTRTTTWLIQDRSGSLWKLVATVKGKVGLPFGPISSIGSSISVDVSECSPIFRGHGGAITGLAVSPVETETYAASISADGSVRCWNTATQSLTLSSRFGHTSGAGASHEASADSHQLRGTCLCWAPTSVDPTGKTIAAGFSDGSVRVLYRGGDEWKRLAVLKPASTSITTISFSPDGKLLVVGSIDGNAFFLGVDSKKGGSSLEAQEAPASIAPAFRNGYTPLGFLTMMSGTDAATSSSGSGGAESSSASESQQQQQQSASAASVTSFAWPSDAAVSSSSLAVGCADGVIRILTLPAADVRWPDTNTSFDLTSNGTITVQGLRIDIEVKKAAPPPPPPTAAEKEAAAAALAGAGKKSRKGASGDDAVVAAEPVQEWPTEITELGKPGNITSLLYSTSRILVGCSGDGGHFIHELTLPKNPKFGVVRGMKPSACYPLTPLYSGENVRRPHTTNMAYAGEGNQLLLTTTSTGSLYVRATSSLAAMMRVQLSDSDSGGSVVVCASPNGSQVLVGGGDGALTFLTLPTGAATIATTLAAAVPVHTAVNLTAYAPVDLRLATLVGPAAVAGSSSSSSSGSGSAHEEKKSEGGDETNTGAGAEAGSAAEADAARAAKDVAAAAAALAAAQSPIPYLAQVPADPLTYTESTPTSSSEDPGDLWLNEHSAADITDPTVYSIQEDRLKSAEDARKRDAEVEKGKVRNAIAALRESFSGLRQKVQQESTVHPARGLNETELELDPELTALLRGEGETRLREVDKEFAYDRARRRVALSKLVRAFLSDVAFDSESVSTIRDTSLKVWTVRTTEMPPELADAIAAAEGESAANSRPPSATATRGVAWNEKGASANDNGGDAATTHNIGAGSGGFAAGADREEERKESVEEISFDFRKKLRQDRRTALKALEGKRPGPNDEDAGDVALVNWAKDHMGDYRLKTDKSYRVPEGVKLDNVSKRRQTLLLEGHIHRLRCNFNAKVLTLRSRKRAVVTALREAEAEVVAIDAELSTGPTARILAAAGEDLPSLLPFSLQNPAVTSFALPNLEAAVTAEELAGWESLTALAARHVSDAMAERSWDAHVKRAGTDATSAQLLATFGGVMSSFLKRLHQQQQQQGHKALSSPSSSSSTSSITSTLSLHSSSLSTATNAANYNNNESKAVVLACPDAHGLVLRPYAANGYTFDASTLYGTPIVPTAGLWAALPSTFFHTAGASSSSTSTSSSSAASSQPPSPEIVEAAVVAAKALGDRKAALRLRQVALLEGFDAAIIAARRERVDVQAASVSSSLRLAVLRQELALLTDMAKRDSALESRLAKSKADKAGIATAVAQFAAQVADKKVELDALSVREKALLSEFDESVGSSHSAYSQLLKIYRRKIKRAKATTPAAGGGAAPVEEEEEDDLDDLDGLDEDDDDDEEETCPENCTKEMYERVLAMRNRRLDVTDMADEINKAIDEIRKTSDKQVQRERQVDRDLTSINNEIVIFQREKQGKLNTIDTWVVLKASQLLAGKQPPPAVSTEGTPEEIAAATAAAAASDDGRPIGSLPASVDNCVLFTRAGLHRLRSRIGELDIENKKLAVAHKDLGKEERRLAAEKKALEAEIASVRSQCDDIQVLKFGKVIDVEALDRATGVTAETLAAVQQEQEKLEAEAAFHVLAARKHMNQLQEKLTILMRQHTSTLESIATLQARLAALEGELSGKASSGLTAVALHATIGTGLATAVAGGKLGAGSLAALQPVLAKGAQAKRLASGAAASDPKNSSGVVTAGLTLSTKAGGVSSMDETVAARQEAAERSRLVALVTRQATLLESMKAEASMLRSKGGPAHVPEAEVMFIAATEAAAAAATSRSGGGGNNTNNTSMFKKTLAANPPKAPLLGGGTMTSGAALLAGLGLTGNTFVGGGVTVGAAPLNKMQMMASATGASSSTLKGKK